MDSPLPDFLKPYWSSRVDDPRDKDHYCPKQARKTPAIPWHNSDPCLACGKIQRPEFAKYSQRA